MTDYHNISTTTGCPVTIEEIWINTIFLSTVSILTIIGNSIALHAFIVSPELKKITYFFIASLCISDLMIGIISIPFWVVHTLTCWEQEYKYLNHAYLALDIFCATWSIMSLAMISIERLICIKYALHYQRIITRKRAYYLIALVLLYSAVVTGIEIAIDLKREKDAQTYTDLADRKKKLDIASLQLTVVFLAYFVPVIIKLVSYQNIYKEASRHSAKIRSLQRFRWNNNSDRPSEFDSSELPTISKESPELEKLTVESADSYSKQNGDDEESYYSDDSVNISSNHETVKSSGFWRKLTSVRNKRDFDMLLQQRNIEKKTNDNCKDQTDNSISSKIKEHLAYIKPADLSNVEYKRNFSLNESLLEVPCNTLKVKRSGSYPSYLSHNALLPKNLQEVVSVSTTFKEPNNPCGKPLHKSFKLAPKRSPALSASPSLLKKSLKMKRKSEKRHEQKIKKFKKELRAAKIVGLIMGTFLFCWTPFILIVILDTFNVEIKVRYVVYFKDLHYLNSTLNPILYVILNKVYRRAVVKTFMKLKTFLKR